MPIDGQTRLSQVIDAVPGALDYIVSLKPHDFQRLRNPVLRTYMASRISLARVAAIAGVSEATLVGQLRRLAGAPEVGEEAAPAAATALPASPRAAPAWMTEVDVDAIPWVDLLPVDAVGGDPFPAISLAVRQLAPGAVLGIRHRWEPQPFYDIWSKMGLDWYARPDGPAAWQIFVHRPLTASQPPIKDVVTSEVGNLPPTEVVPRIVSLSKQLQPGQALDVGGLPRGDDVRDAVLEQLGPAYTWSPAPARAGRRVARIVRADGGGSSP